MLLVRAIVRSVDTPRSATPDLVVVRADRVAALATRSDRMPIPTDTELRDHEKLARRIHDAVPSLPSRFGQQFADEPALARALLEREPALVQSLDAVGERVELAVTLRWRKSAIADQAHEASTGRAYLEARALRERERQAAEQIVARLVEQLPCERAFIRHSVCPRDGVAAAVAILSTRDEVKNLQRAATSFGERSAEVSAVVHGPLPPYTFTE